MKDYEIFEIKDRKLIKELINQDPHKLLNEFDFESIVVEVDNVERKAFINLKELFIFIDYNKALECLTKNNIYV